MFYSTFHVDFSTASWRLPFLEERERCDVCLLDGRWGRPVVRRHPWVRLDTEGTFSRMVSPQVELSSHNHPHANFSAQEFWYPNVHVALTPPICPPQCRRTVSYFPARSMCNLPQEHFSEATLGSRLQLTTRRTAKLSGRQVQRYGGQADYAGK